MMCAGSIALHGMVNDLSLNYSHASRLSLDNSAHIRCDLVGKAAKHDMDLFRISYPGE